MLRRALVSFIFVLIASFTAMGDPVIPAGTVVGGTITANRLLFQSIVGNLNALDGNGNPFLVGFSSQGGSLDFRGLPGTPVVFHAGIAGSADQGNAAIMVSFQGTGPVIPNVNTPTLDLIGFATIQFSGTVFANHSDMFIGDNPLFTISGIFSGPVALHFTLEPDGFYQLQSATANLSELTEVPEPLSVLLFGSGLPLAIAMRRRSKDRQR